MLAIYWRIFVLLKEKMISQVETRRTIIRLTTTQDLEQLQVWENYSAPYQCFNMADGQQRMPDGKLWWERIDKSDRVFYSVLLKNSNEIVGVYAFTRIDWNDRIINNMVIRIKPNACDKGYGHEVLIQLLKSMLDFGFCKIRLDVAATNPRAVRCYKKSGMRITGEFWQPHKGDPIDFNDSYWSTLQAHFKKTEQGLMIKFYCMEIDGFIC
jgi:RimJ/RimL family protein N-acetyltransferase